MLKQINEWCREYWYLFRVLIVVFVLVLFFVPPIRNGIFELLDLPTYSKLKGNDFAHVEAGFAELGDEMDRRFALVDRKFERVDYMFLELRAEMDLKFEYQNKKMDLILSVLMEETRKSEIKSRLYEIEAWYNVELEKVLKRKNSLSALADGF